MLAEDDDAGARRGERQRPDRVLGDRQLPARFHQRQPEVADLGLSFDPCSLEGRASFRVLGLGTLESEAAVFVLALRDEIGGNGGVDARLVEVTPAPLQIVFLFAEGRGELRALLRDPVLGLRDVDALLLDAFRELAVVELHDGLPLLHLGPFSGHPLDGRLPARQTGDGDHGSLGRFELAAQEEGLGESAAANPKLGRSLLLRLRGRKIGRTAGKHRRGPRQEEKEE